MPDSHDAPIEETAEPRNDPSLTAAEFGEVIADGLDEAPVPAKPGEGSKPEDETEAHPS